MTLRILLPLLLLALVVAALALTRSSPAPQAGFRTVTVQDLAGAGGENHVVLDVREPWEVAEGHIPGAVLIPLGELSARVDEVPKGAPVYVICRSGNRSVPASETLVAAGFTDVRNVDGGMLAWQAAGLSVTR